MEVIPAIDLKEGKCVRLYQGAFDQVAVFAEDPVAVAQRWEREGAGRLHLVDLEGARSGRPVHLHILRRIRESVALPIQFGGGLRSLEWIERALAEGADRVVLGTGAILQFSLLREAVNRWGDRIVLGLDLKGGKVAVRGWQEAVETSPLVLIRQAEAVGLERVIVTEIGRDGTLQGPAVELYQDLVTRTSLRIIASGGVSQIEDLVALQATGVEGVIVGKALYMGLLQLPEALAVVSKRKKNVG